MSLADFTIDITDSRPDHPQRSVRVVVYSSLSRLRAAASRYDNVSRRPSKRVYGQFANTLGVCHRFEQGPVNDDGEYERDPLCAIIRLAEPNLGVGIISHECCHAAVWINELDCNDDPGALTCSNDEPFAWLLGELVRQTVNGMNERGVFA